MSANFQNRELDAAFDTSAELIGQVLDGRYEIKKLLGEGGMGIVYRARHVTLGKALAVKILKSHVSRKQETVQRFMQEARSASAIGNHHIIDIIDFGTMSDGSAYFVMEFLDGVSLTQAIELGRPLSTDRVVAIAEQLCDALGAAHSVGIIHRDLKPDNIYLISRGRRSDFVKVLDFGIAKVGGSKSKLTQSGQIFGTPYYMSPEQCIGTAIDKRADVYALGVIMYEMLTGRVPFDGASDIAILMAQVQQEVPPFGAVNSQNSVPPSLEAIVRRCLAKIPSARFPSMDAVLSALQALPGRRSMASEELPNSDTVGLDYDPEPSRIARGAIGPTERLSNVTPSALRPIARSEPIEPSPLRPLAEVGPENLRQVVEGQRLSGEVSVVQAKSERLRVGLGVLLALLTVAGGAAFIARGWGTGSVATPAFERLAPMRSAAVEPQPKVPTAQPALTAPPLGPAVIVSLRSTPPGAMVTVGDKTYGPTPTQVEWVNEEASLGRIVTFLFTRAGYRDLTVTRQIREHRLDVDAPAMAPLVEESPVGHVESRPMPFSEPSKSKPKVTTRRDYLAEPY